MLNDIKKIFTQLDSKIVNKIYLIFVLMVFIIGLEVFGISLVIPFLNSITEPDYLIKKRTFKFASKLIFKRVFEQNISNFTDYILFIQKLSAGFFDFS